MTWKFAVWDTVAFGVCALAVFTLFSLADGGAPDFRLAVRLTLGALVVRVVWLLVRRSMRWWRERRVAGPGLPREPYAG